MTTELNRDDTILLILNASMPFAQIVGHANLAHYLIGAGLKLMQDVEGPERAWQEFRDALADATERARLAAHPKPKAAG